jgi:glycosyltransferase involved in cell wall biosynthesis
MAGSKLPILIVAPHIPAWDTNAGDWRVFCLVKELSKKYRIYFCVLNAKTNLEYKPKLSKYVKKIFALPAVSEFAKILKFENIKTVIFEKYFGIDYPKLFKHFDAAQNFIVDTHDIDYIKARRALSKSTPKIKKDETALYKKSNALISISNVDAAHLAKNKKIIVVPTPSENKLKKFRPYEKRAGIALWGYWAYPANAAALKYFNAEIAPKLPPEIKVSVLGYGAKKVKNIQRELSKYKVVAAPLLWGSGVKKKVIDALSAKTPVVTTPVGAEGINIDKRLVCKTADAFAKTLTEVYNNKKLWGELSRSGYKLFIKNYTAQSFKKALKQLYKIIM